MNNYFNQQPGNPALAAIAVSWQADMREGVVHLMDITPYVGTIVTVILAVGGVYAAIAQRLARLEALIENLATITAKHNNVIERVYKLETEVTNLYHRYDEVQDQIKEHQQ